jgi:NADPH:quinone reductase-like Zn-dependent oxidoreductase
LGCLGVVEEVGSGVARFARGDDVFGLVPFPAIGAAHAEYLTALVTNITARPVTIDCLVAAGVPLAELASWQALIEIAGVRRGSECSSTGPPEAWGISRCGWRCGRARR